VDPEEKAGTIPKVGGSGSHSKSSSGIILMGRSAGGRREAGRN